jgi:ABC-type nitrate/sulfonate/bicarbonate transport system permease component
MSAAIPSPVDVPRRPLPDWLPSVLGAVGVLVIWQVAGMTIFQGSNGNSGVVPPPTAVIEQMVSDGAAFYWNNLVQTLREAGWGWLWGNGLAVLLAVIFVQVPIIERGLLRLAVASYCLPIIAIAPVLVILFGNGEAPKIILAALSVFFTTLIAMIVGLRSADETSLELVHAYGGGSLMALRTVRLRSSLPSLFAGLRIAAPAAMLGAMIGEYMGADTGLGVAMINSQQALETERTWAIALVASAAAGILYALTALVGRWATPWAPRSDR